MADFGAMGMLGLLLANGRGFALPGLGLHGALGGRVTETTGVFAVLDAALLFTGQASVVMATLAPGLRLGEAGHATVALGPSLLVVSAPGVGATSVAGTVLLRGVFLLKDALGVHAQLAFTFDASGLVIQLGVGLGGSVL